MKILSFLLSIYLLTLSCLPCADEQDCNEVQETVISKASQHENHHHQQETCSPFCTCACCGQTVVFLYNSPSINPIRTSNIIERNPVCSFFNEAFSSNFYANIWQPPKV